MVAIGIIGIIINIFIMLVGTMRIVAKTKVEVVTKQVLNLMILYNIIMGLSIIMLVR